MQATDKTFEWWKSNLKKGKLVGLKCKDCGSVIFPIQMICINCGKQDLEPIELKGEGEILTYTVIHTVPEGLESLAPVIVALVKLDEGPICMCRGVNVSAEEVKIGQRVKIGWLTQSIYDVEDIVLTFSIKR